MGSTSAAVGAALFFGYLIHYVLHLLALGGKAGLKLTDIEERAGKLYLFGFIGILSIHFASTYAAVFSWFTLITLIVFYCSALVKDPHSKRKLYTTSRLVYTMFLTFWWIGETATIFANLG